MSKDSREITRKIRLPAWPGLSSRRGTRIFYWGPKRFNLYNRWFSPGRRSNSPSCASTHAVSFYLDWAFHPWSIITILLLLIILLVCAIKLSLKGTSSERKVMEIERDLLLVVTVEVPPKQVDEQCSLSIIVMEGLIYITGSWLLATSPCHENHPSLAEGDTKTFRIHNFFR